MFKDAALKMAGLYLSILMLISVFFSLNVYQISVQEFDRGLRRPPGSSIQRAGQTGPNQDLLRQLESERSEQYRDAKNRILNRLLVTNLLIFFGGGFLSYYLSKRTLAPIEEAHEAQNRFTADASHELRTPLAAMQSEIEVALMNPRLRLNTARDVLKSNLEELTKLTILSEGLLSLARFQNGKLDVSPIDLHGPIQGSIDTVTGLAKKKNITIKNDISKKIVVLADGIMLKEAFVTILDNAVKYSAEKTEIDISSSIEGKTAVVKIKDQGIGIDASDLPHIFSRFYQSEMSRNKSFGSGFGIGLAIAKNIVDLHSGDISVTSERGKGSVFTIRLPLG